MGWVKKKKQNKKTQEWQFSSEKKKKFLLTKLLMKTKSDLVQFTCRLPSNPFCQAAFSTGVTPLSEANTWSNTSCLKKSAFPVYETSRIITSVPASDSEEAFITARWHPWLISLHFHFFFPPLIFISKHEPNEQGRPITAEPDYIHACLRSTPPRPARWSHFFPGSLRIYIQSSPVCASPALQICHDRSDGEPLSHPAPTQEAAKLRGAFVKFASLCETETEFLTRDYAMVISDGRKDKPSPVRRSQGLAWENRAAANRQPVRRWAWPAHALTLTCMRSSWAGFGYL